MKIAMLGHKRMPSREGGVEIVVEELSTRMAKLGHDVYVYNRKGKNVQDNSIKTKNLSEYKGVHVKKVFTLENKNFNAIIYTILATLKCLFGKYDVIHYHAEGPCSMIWIPHLFKIRTVATIHGLDWKRAKWKGFASKYIKFGEKMAAKYADEIIVLSKDVQDYFKEQYNRNTHFIPNGIEIPDKKKSDIIKKKWNIEQNSYILYLSRIVPEKGLHYLIEAFRNLNTDKKLVIAGGASHTSEYLEQIKEMIQNDDRIIMTGFVEKDELQELYSNCFLYCLPSDVEGMPISLLEAMSYGCNILTSDIKECTDVVLKYGESFKNGNVEDLRMKLEKCLNNIQRDKSEIIKYLEENYNWNMIVQKTIKLYK